MGKAPGNPMDDATYESYGKYTRELADLLLLRDWEITLTRDAPINEDATAAVSVMDVENRASIYLSGRYWHQTAEERREYLVHELLHCHLDRCKRVMGQLADQWDENSACQFAREAHRKETEICVQKFARLLAPFMPLPPPDD